MIWKKISSFFILFFPSTPSHLFLSRSFLTLFFTLCLSLSLSLSLPLCLFLSLYLSLCLSLTFTLSLRLSPCLSLSLFISVSLSHSLSFSFSFFLSLSRTGNDLDLSTLTALEEYLTEVFDGCLVVVSHDNFFVNRVAEHLFVFEGDGVVRDFEGTYVLYCSFNLIIFIHFISKSYLSHLFFFFLSIFLSPFFLLYLLFFFFCYFI